MKQETNQDGFLSRIKPDFHSLKFKLGLHFILFALILMIMLWFLQIFFLNNYYEEMKIKETNRIAHLIITQYGNDGFVENVSELSSSNDLYIHIETSSGSVIFEPTTYGSSHASFRAYVKEIGALKESLYESTAPSVAMRIPVSGTNYNTLAYATYLDRTAGSEVMLYIFSPLYPVESTVSILTNQLAYVTVISLLFAALFGIYLSRRVSIPLSEISKTAKRLAKGEYGIRFRGEHYSEIINLADTLTYTSMQLERADNMQKDLIANVSHDLRTPLTMVKSYAEMIRDLSGDNPEKRNAHLQVIIDEADRLNVLVSDMLTMSKVQSGVSALDKTVFSIKEATESILQSYGVLIEQEGYTILFDCPDGINVYADEAKIKQVISNLLNNAVKYCGTDRTVYVTVKKHHGKMRFEVTDHGMGIEPSELENIWERYYKASTNHVRTTSGSGLGLSIVKSLLSLHNADFGVNSKLGQGSTFWFELNIAQKNERRQTVKENTH